MTTWHRRGCNGTTPRCRSRNIAKNTFAEGWLQKSYEFAGLRTAPATHRAKNTANSAFSCGMLQNAGFGTIPWGGGGSEPRTGIIYIYIYIDIHLCFSIFCLNAYVICIFFSAFDRLRFWLAKSMYIFLEKATQALNWKCLITTFQNIYKLRIISLTHMIISSATGQCRLAWRANASALFKCRYLHPKSSSHPGPGQRHWLSKLRWEIRP